ncbi:hypothetical protein [Halosimplex marinum]|uniref:hypothetical protein n=1 Tax=Halosimplex marinum TaxID=3396620 RepID=UPI003F549AEC
MPSRRHLLAGLGSAVAVGALAGCPADGATAGTVARKAVTVAVPRRTGEPVDARAALLGYEPDRRLVHGEYDPDHVAAAVDGATVSVPDDLHETLADAFASVRYGANVVPDDGTPINGVVSRADFNALAVGGEATVAPYQGEDGVGHASVREAAPRERDPTEVTVATFDLDERLDG